MKKLEDRNVICLYGELGVGKTTFVQGLAKELGVKKRVTSPTFILIREYKIKNCQIAKLPNCKFLYHTDCYRIKSERDVKSIDLSEIWEDKNNLVVIEWAGKIKKILPQKRIDIKFEYISKNKRKIIIDDFIN